MTDLRLDPAPSRPAPGRSRAQWALLAAVLALLVAALVFGRDDAPPAQPVVQPVAGPDAAELAELRATADLAPCPPGLGPAFPDVVLPCLDGRSDVPLASPPGRPLLVNVWASWCGPCVEEVPALREVAARAGDRVGVVGVLTQDSLRSALTFADAFDMGYPSVVDDEGVVLREFAPGPPITLFVDAQGRIVHRELGAFRDAAEIRELLATHLGVEVAA